jgi:hypothetical protein
VHQQFKVRAERDADGPIGLTAPLFQGYASLTVQNSDELLDDCGDKRFSLKRELRRSPIVTANRSFE